MSAPRLVSIFAILFLALTGPSVQAAPPLVQIADTLLKADGTPFNGNAVITWRTFVASDGTTIAGNTITVQVVDGILRVKLVPTSNASGNAYYIVRFNSNGITQFTEIWTVPATSTALQLSEVRVQTPPGAVVVAPANALQMSEVAGLTEALANRPTKSVGYTTDRVAMIDSLGQLAAVSGSLTDCVRVDGTSGACGTGSASIGFVDFETPSGVTDGANVTFTLSQTPAPARSLLLFRNGLLQTPLVDFTLTGNTVRFMTVTAPQSGDVLTASYRTGGQ